MFLPWDFNCLDRKIQQFLHVGTYSQAYNVFTDQFPMYRFVDFFRALDSYAKDSSEHHFIDASSDQRLWCLTHQKPWHQIRPSERRTFTTGYDHEDKFPAASYWLLRGPEGMSSAERIAVSLRIENEHTYFASTLVEIAAKSEEVADAVKKRIEVIANENSIYRNAVVETVADENVPDDYGYIRDPSRLSLRFTKIKRVSTSDIVLDKNVKRILQRNLFDFHEQRESLKRHGIPNKRAVLFHGPPGTGKTYTAQYIYNQLKNVTTFVVTGQALNKVETVCQLARTMQPSLVVIEDVDLIFASREINLYSSAMGDFMDQLDGFKNDDQVTFVMTTNALERVEEAIKDRPGRINQCIYFGPPSAELRHEYLVRYLRQYNTRDVALDELVTMTEGVTQAFLKEFVFRAIMICLERQGYNGAVPKLQTKDFRQAMDEITQKDNNAQYIIGFRARQPA